MKYIAAFSLFFVLRCATPGLVERGSVRPADCYTRLSFATARSILLLPATFEGKTRNYLFDTGAQLTAVHRDSIFGERFTVRGATNRTVENGSETLGSFRIGEVEFVNIFANNQNFAELSAAIPDFGGLIGRSIINKARWLIDYPDKTLEVTSRDLVDATFTEITLDPETDAPYAYLDIDGKSYRVIVDLGSSSAINVPEGSELARDLLAKYPFEENERERYTVGGTQITRESVSSLPEVRIGDVAFRNVAVNVNESSQPRVGIRFFADCLIYIDGIEGRYWFKQK